MSYQRRNIIMISKRLKKLVKGTALVGAMVFGLVIVSHTDVSAQNRDYRNGQNRRYESNRRVRVLPQYDRRNSAKIAYQRGYNDGFRYGLQSGRYGNNRNGNYGNGGWGDSSSRNAYQKGFKKGYKDGRKRSRSRNSRGYNSVWPY